MDDGNIYYKDFEYGDRLLISSEADITELDDNVRAARAILRTFEDVDIRINRHILIPNHKNPEYTIDDVVGDRKGICSEKGVSEAFTKGKKQGCKIIVLDLDMHMANQPLRDIKLSKELYFRNRDFMDGSIEACYIVYHNKAAIITKDIFYCADKEMAKRNIRDIIQKIAD